MGRNVGDFLSATRTVGDVVLVAFAVADGAAPAPAAVMERGATGGNVSWCAFRTLKL